MFKLNSASRDDEDIDDFRDFDEETEHSKLDDYNDEEEDEDEDEVEVEVVVLTEATPEPAIVVISESVVSAMQIEKAAAIQARFPNTYLRENKSGLK